MSSAKFEIGVHTISGNLALVTEKGPFPVGDEDSHQNRQPTVGLSDVIS